MNRTVLLELTPSGIDAVIKEVEAFWKEADRKEQLVLERLADDARSTAQRGFDSGYGETGDEVTVTKEPTERGYNVTATGQKVLFQEFGAGVGATHPLGGEFGYTPGSWSDTHGQQYSTKGFWYHNKLRYTGIPAKRAMFNAYTSIKNRAREIAKEVFSND